MTQLVDTKRLALSLLKATETVWHQRPGAVVEPMDHAWKRLFNEPMSTPLLFQHVIHEGRDLVVRLHPKGRISVLDPAAGHHIRTRPAHPAEQVVDALIAGKSVEPRVAAAAVRWLVQTT